MALIIISKVECWWIKIRGLCNSLFTPMGTDETLSSSLMGNMQNAPSWVRRSSCTSVSEPRIFHAFPTVSLQFDTHMSILVNTRNCRCMCGDRTRTLVYKVQPSFLIKVHSFFSLTTEGLILLTLNQYFNSHQVQWYQTFQNKDRIYLKHQVGKDNNRRNDKITHTHFRHSSWFLLQSKWGDVVPAEALSVIALFHREENTYKCFTWIHREIRYSLASQSASLALKMPAKKRRA